MINRLRPIILSALVFLLVLALGGAFINLFESRRSDEKRQMLKEIGTAQAHLLERQLDRSLSSTFALASILRRSGRIDNFDALAAEMIRSYGGISSLQLAPNGVVTQIYPMAGNEAAVGHDLLKDPRRRTEALAAIESRRLTLAGPFTLIQGGKAVIGRLPVFVPDEAGDERFWGFTIALIHLGELLEVSNLTRLVEGGYNYELSRTDPDSGTRAVFARSTQADLENTIPFEIEVPNGRWTLAVAPLGEWQFSSFLPVKIGLLFLVSALIASFAYSFARRPESLRRLVEFRTNELAETNTTLRTEITERKRAEEALREAHGQLEIRVQERTKELVEANAALNMEVTERKQAEEEIQQAKNKYENLIKNIPDVIYSTLPDESGTTTFISERWRDWTGYDPGDFYKDRETWPKCIHPKDRDNAVQAFISAIEEKRGYEFEYRVVHRKTGQVRNLRDCGIPVLNKKGEITKFDGIVTDITERKRADEALRQAHDQLERRVQERTKELAETNTTLRTEITERKRAEEALQESQTALRLSIQEIRELAGKLLFAQEEERRRLARELHDDFTQRLAVLAIDVGRLEQQLQSTPEPVSKKLHEMKGRIVRLSEDIHKIARQLHPSILEDLGLADAIESECTRFSEQEKIQVNFKREDFPERLPKDVSLCIYRIAQEGLRNVAKHAHAKKVRIRLRRTNGSLVLSIRDTGVGFDTAGLEGKQGLGLASMEERVRLIRGSLSIYSEPGQGTTIEVRAPLG